MATAQTQFTAMRDATRDDYQQIGRHSLNYGAGVQNRLNAWWGER